MCFIRAACVKSVEELLRKCRNVTQIWVWAGSPNIFLAQRHTSVPKWWFGEFCCLWQILGWVWDPASLPTNLFNRVTGAVWRTLQGETSSSSLLTSGVRCQRSLNAAKHNTGKQAASGSNEDSIITDFIVENKAKENCWIKKSTWLSFMYFSQSSKQPMTT